MNDSTVEEALEHVDTQIGGAARALGGDIPRNNELFIKHTLEDFRKIYMKETGWTPTQIEEWLEHKLREALR